MHFPSVIHVLGNLLLLLAATLVLPLTAALTFDDAALPLERYEVLGFFCAIAVAGLSGMLLRTVFETDLKRVGHREGAAIVTLSWVLFSAVGCLPFVISGAANFTDAFFETISGFTTTGATIFTSVEVLPHGLQLWRCETQWLGGMGIVVLSVAVLPMLGAGGYRLFKAEAPGGSTFERNAPRIKDTAKVLWFMYLSMTIIQGILLKFGGMTLFEALCHGFTTMSTGGFSTSNASVAGFPSPMIQWTIIAFMFLAGINFDVHQQLFIDRQFKRAFSNTGLRVYSGIILTATVLCVLILLNTEQVAKGAAEPTVRHSLFAVLTVSTTTGYGTEDFDKWPDLLRLTLFLLMFVGGCSGSTSGGMKVVRVVIFFKAALAEIRRSISPRAVHVVRVGPRTLDQSLVGNVMSFIIMWLALYALFTFLLTALGLDLLSATTATTASLGNIGPGLGSVGPTCNYAHIPDTGKWLLSFAMLLGRLELYSVLALFLRRTWTRY